MTTRRPIGKRIVAVVAGLSCLVCPLAARAEVVVIVHPDNPLQSMTPKEVSDLYLGRTRTLGTGDQALPAAIYEHPADSPLRETFFRSLNGMTINQLNAYWARLRFSGEVLPPETLRDGHAVVDAVKRNRRGIGYVNSTDAMNSVKIVLRLKE